LILFVNMLWAGQAGGATPLDPQGQAIDASRK